jgi:light-regulated signal transduction histidine kinase (bacteriophytochrome)
VLEYASSGTGLAADAVDTSEFMADVAASMASALERLDGRLEISALPTVRGDRAQLGRAFQNLVANGLKFHSDEPPHVSVSAERHDATWLFNVRDNGVGVPPELGDEIFSMFKRAHGEEIEGCGIGLAVCRKIVEAHGGVTWVEPADASGTLMRFTVLALQPSS